MQRALIGFAAAALSLVVSPAQAAEWIADPDASKIGFVYERAGGAAEGAFTRFAGGGRFDPARPEEAELRLAIETRSIELGTLIESAFATSAEWFDSGQHPEAIYELITLTPLGEDRFEAFGTLSIKGRTRSLRSEITLSITEVASGGQAMAMGALTVNRRAFGLGIGPVSAFVTIGDQVTVNFALAAAVAEGASEPNTAATSDE
ncbi:MAG: YceI family protein [Pseudomonadota bacterium]